jgi:hypothetical protein
VLAGAAVAAFAAPLRAEPKREPSRAELEERIRRLEKIIEEHGLDKPVAPATAPAAAPRPPRARPRRSAAVETIVDEKLKKQKMLAGWKDGFFLESPDGDFKMKLNGYLQVDSRTFPNNGGDTGFNNMYLRRAARPSRPRSTSTSTSSSSPTSASTPATLADAFLEVNYFPEAKLRAGQVQAALQPRAAAVGLQHPVHRALDRQQPHAEPRHRRAAGR